MLLGLSLWLLIGGTALAANPPSDAVSPEQELALFHFADDQLTAELVASEPDVISPVSLAWDADGRLFVAEMIDYPSGPLAGQIRVLEDKDGDGRYETATVFADKLPYPNCVLPWNGGILVTAAPNLWFLKDSDGDGRADERHILLTGFAEGNQQLRANGLFYGLDNWVYGANGRSDGEVRRPDDPQSNAVSIRKRDFRFRPATGEFEAIAGQSQFGVAHDDWGNRFLSWNTIPIRHEVLEERYAARNPNLTGVDSVQNLLPPGDTGQVFPLTPAPLVFNTESSSHFNALAGLTIYRGDALGAAYRGNAFMGESLRNLVHRRILKPSGVSFVALRGEAAKEFLASDDPWFHPVNYATGPDGALYIADFYRRFVEHPDYIPGNLRAQVPWRTGAEHGRIWRVRLKTDSQRRVAARPQLTRASVAELVRTLGHTNGWWRDTAQRLLVERQERSAIPKLKTQISNLKSGLPLARLHALWTLEGLRALDARTLATALNDPNPGVRENAVRAAESFLASSGQQRDRIEKDLARAAGDSEARVRFRVALAAGEFGRLRKIDVLGALANQPILDRWFGSAILCSVGNDAWPLIQQLVKIDPRWIDASVPARENLLLKLGEMIGRGGNEDDLRGIVRLNRAFPNGLGGLILVSAAADQLPKQTPESTALRELKKGMAERSEPAAALAISERESMTVRLAAIRILAHAPSGEARKSLRKLIAESGREIQAEAVRALLEWDDTDAANELFAHWQNHSASVRRQVIAGALGSSAMIRPLLSALETGIVRPEDLESVGRQRLRQAQNPELQKWIAKLGPIQAAPNRKEVIQSFQPALKLSGERRHGAELFAKTCLVCHSVQGEGGRIGPDLAGVAVRPKEALLVDILDPSQQITPDFMNYTVQLTQGEPVSGLLVSETAAGVVLRRPNEPDVTVLRRDIVHLKADGKSPMPEGLEEGLSQQDMADLLEFLSRPEKSLLPKGK